MFVKRVAPEHAIVACAEQLDREMNPIACLADLAHEQRVDAELTCCGLRGLPSPAVFPHDVRRPDRELAQVIQFGNERIGDSKFKGFVTCVAGNRLKR